MKISALNPLPSMDGSEIILLAKGGMNYRATLEDIRAATPDADGIYPDVPLNRVRLIRFAQQTSTVPTITDNTGLAKKILSMCFPCTINRNSIITSYLNGNDVRKTVDGLNSVINDYSNPAMVRMGGYWQHYHYDATTNEKIFDLSPYKVKGYKYVRRRFLAMYGGYVYNDGSNNLLTSVSGAWTTQGRSLIEYHQFARNIGTHFREHAAQDQEVYRMMFWLTKATFDSQSVYHGIVDINGWDKFDQSSVADSFGGKGQSAYAQHAPTGYMNDVAGHEGQKTLTLTNSKSVQSTVYPYKFLWIDHLLAGPYFIWSTGYIKKGGIWYKANDINNISTFDVDANYTQLCNECTDGGWILEDFEDTIIPSSAGASTSTGHADYYWRDTNMSAVYVPGLVGSSYNGVSCGVSCLYSSNGPSDATSDFGASLASDDPSDTISDSAIA